MAIITINARRVLQQKKTSIQTPFDPKPYKVTDVKGSQVAATRGKPI